MNPSTLYKICLVGFGPANILLAGYLIHRLCVDPCTILIVDPYHDGGALIRQWSHVVSNTTYGQFVDALSSLGIPVSDSAGIEHSKPTHLCVIGRMLVDAVRVSGARRIFGRVHALVWSEEEQVWSVETSAGNFKARAVSLAPGAQPKCLQTGVPQIPLEHALTADTLRPYFPSGADPAATPHVSVFGTAHSGVLVAEALVSAGATVSLIYNTPTPFYFADEGAYDGVKQDTAVVARRILADGLGGKVQLLQYSDSLAIHEALTHSRWTVCACGFETPHMPVVRVGATVLKNDKGIPYNPATGQIGCRMYGWGIAFPSMSTIDGRQYADVSIPSFAAHILRQADEISAMLR